MQWAVEGQDTGCQSSSPPRSEEHPTLVEQAIIRRSKTFPKSVVSIDIMADDLFTVLP
jgi:hypothetical protein